MRQFVAGTLGAALILVLSCAAALAQSTGGPIGPNLTQPVVPGYYSTSGCKPTDTYCFYPYTSSVPLPVTGPGSGGSFTANQGTPGAITAGWPVTDGAGPDTTGTLVSGAGTIIAPIDGYASLKIQVKGTYAAFTFNTLTSSDGGTTYVPLQCAAIDGTKFGTSFTMAANQSLEIACGHQSGDDNLEVQTASGPATGTANFDISSASFPSDDGSTVAVAPLAPTARNFPGCTVGSSSGSCLAASTAKTFLQIQNTSVSASIACAFGTSAVLNSSGSVQLGVGQAASWGVNTGGVPTGQMNCIASGASTPLYVEWN